MFFVLKYLLLLAILPLLLIPIYSEELYGQLSDVALIVTTDKSFYLVNETILITGEVRDLDSGTPVSIIIIAPNENLVAILQTSVNDDKTFSMEYTLGNPLMKSQGTYIITAQYGNENLSATTSFDYIKITDSITITTDKSSYIQGDLIFISGQLSNLYNGTSIYISLAPSHGFRLPVGNITTNNNSFNATLNTENNIPVWLPGSYTLTAYYETVYASTTFELMDNSSSLTISTDKLSYNEGEIIHISGQIQNLTNSTLSISIYSDIGGYIGNIPNITTNNNNFIASINTENNTSIDTEGEYMLTAHYGDDMVSTTFDYHTSTEEDGIPASYIYLSDREISKWTNQITQWENAQNRTDHQIELYYDKLDRAITRNQTDKIEQWTIKIGHSMALSELYDGIIECLEEQIELYS